MTSKIFYWNFSLYLFFSFFTYLIRLQSTYNPAELDYFRVLIKTIAVEENYTINSIVALNLSNQVVVAKLPKQKAEALLDKWTYLGYFMKIEDQLFFGPKMQAEFPTFLKDKFPDSVQSCVLCNCILLWVNIIEIVCFSLTLITFFQFRE